MVERCGGVPESGDRFTYDDLDVLVVKVDHHRIEELRVGGQTKRITVQPKSGNAPEYEIKPPDATRGQAGTGNDSQVNTAPPVWNIKKF